MCRILLLLGVFSRLVCGAFPGLRYLGEVGHLGTPSDPRTSVRFGRAQAVSVDDGIVFRGRDDDGKKWQAILPVEGGIAFTDVWEADFDHNSRQDLLIAAFPFANGRCTDGVMLSFLMFNDHGRPVPWVIETHALSSHLPAIFADFNQDGRAELAVTDCAYSDPSDTSRFGVDRKITGIYEAKDAAWSLIKPAHLDAYTALVRKSLHLHARFDSLFPPNPADWADQGNRLDSHRAPPIQLAAVLTPSEECRGPVHLPPVVNGELQTAGWKDPCDELGHDRIQLSNGAICYDWPIAILDGENGREIVAETQGSAPLVRETLERVLHQHLTVLLAGQRDPKRCSPVLLWAVPR
jgi:hypothetical protein